MGGILGAGAGATIGAITSQSLGGGIVGAVLGMVGGAIAGSIADGQRGSGRGIEVTVQKDDGQQVTVAQPDDGDIQLGDRVQIVQNRQGVAQVVRQSARNADTSGTFQRIAVRREGLGMFGKWLLSLLVPLGLAGTLGACNGSSGAVQPGVVNTSAAGGYRGETGRVIAIREVPVRERQYGRQRRHADRRRPGRRGRCRDRRRHHQLGGRRGGRRPAGRRGGRHRRHGDRPERDAAAASR